MLSGVIYEALINGLIVAALTSLGAVTALIGARLPGWSLDFSLGFASGIMIVASFTSLILPAFEKGLYIDVGVGILFGILAIVALDIFVPHEHLVSGYEGPEILRNRVRKTLLVAIAIAIHNIPEGLTVSVTTVFSYELGAVTTIAIGLQDVPEGAAVALPLAALWGGRLKGFAIGVLSGFTETIFALIGALAFSYASSLLGIGMGFAAGAMIYTVIEEVLPEILHESSRNRRIATLGFFIGLYTMLYLDLMLR
jgi:ZIP family zinc transporter